MYCDKTLVSNALKSLEDHGEIQTAGSVDGNIVESNGATAPSFQSYRTV